MKLYKKMIGFIALAGVSSQLLGFEYKLGGSAEAFGKFGFNNGLYNIDSQKYPTDSYAALLGMLELEANWESGLKAGLGGALNSLVYDSTNAQGGEALGAGYIGAWYGYHGHYAENNPRGYILHNAYVSYEGEHFGFKAGRYESEGLDWFNAWNQGAEAYVSYGGAKLWGFFSDSRAMVYSNWFWDYTRFTLAGKQLYAGGASYHLGGFGIEGYIYAASSIVSAPGFKLSYDSNPSFEGKGVRSQSTFIALFPRNGAQPRYHNGELIESDLLFGIPFSEDSSLRGEVVSLPKSSQSKPP